MSEAKWCQRQDSCPLLLGAIEAKVEAEYKARVAKHNQDAAAQAFETKRTLFNEFYKLVARCRKAQKRYFAERTQSALIASKEAERGLDAHLAMLRSASSRKPQLQAGIEVPND
jgi:hypothetical protein